MGILLKKKFLPELYETDQYEWRNQIINLLGEGKLSEIDAVNLRVYLIEMGDYERGGLANLLIVLIQHLLKAKYQPGRIGNSWISSIDKTRTELVTVTSQNKNFRKNLEKDFDGCYQKARKNASRETNLDISVFPVEPPFTLSQVLDDDYFPNKERANQIYKSLKRKK